MFISLVLGMVVPGGGTSRAKHKRQLDLLIEAEKMLNAGKRAGVIDLVRKAQVHGELPEEYRYLLHI